MPGNYRKHYKIAACCHYCGQFEVISGDLKQWAKVEREGQVLYFHDRELGDCYDLWLLSPWEDYDGKDNHKPADNPGN